MPQLMAGVWRTSIQVVLSDLKKEWRPQVVDRKIRFKDVSMQGSLVEREGLVIKVDEHSQMWWAKVVWICTGTTCDFKPRASNGEYNINLNEITDLEVFVPRAMGLSKGPPPGLPRTFTDNGAADRNSATTAT